MGAQASRARALAWSLSLWLCLCAMGLPLHAAAQQAEPAAVVLRAQMQGISLVGAMGVIVDEDGRLDAAQLQTPAVQARWRYPAEAVRASLDTRPYWFKIRVRQTTASGDWVLSVPLVAVRDLQFFGPFDEAGRALGRPHVTGLAHPYDTRTLRNERFVFRFLPAAAGDYTIYVRAVSGISQQYALSVWDTGEYLSAGQGKRLFDGICYGLLLGMLLYNTVLLFVFRDRIYAYYLLTCGFAMLAIAGFNGHAARYLLAQMPGWSEAVLVAAPALWILFGALFGRDFLELAQRAPRIDRAVRALVGLALLAALSAFAGYTVVGMALVEVSAMAVAVVMFCGALQSRWRGYLPANWYLLGLAALFVSTFAVVLSNWGLVHTPLIQLNGLQVGVVTEVMVFAIALGSRIRLMRLERRLLNQRAAVLAEAAQTDALTGLANRAGLSAHAEQLAANAVPRALMLIDLDNFKPVNDRLGHEAGDAVLVQMAARLVRQVRPGDTVARLGGDEFVVLFDGAPERATLEGIARRLLQVLAEPVNFRGERVAVGGSVGVARDPEAHMDLAQLLRAADAAMYHIKQHGRAGYAFHEDLARVAEPQPAAPT